MRAVVVPRSQRRDRGHPAPHYQGTSVRCGRPSGCVTLLVARIASRNNLLTEMGVHGFVETITRSLRFPLKVCRENQSLFRTVMGIKYPWSIHFQASQPRPVGYRRFG